MGGLATRGRTTLVLGLVLLAACALQAQAARPEWTRDPYTKGDVQALARAGYVRLDGVTWGDDHDTRDVEQVLGLVPLVWIETAHFRLGCALPEHPVQLEEKSVLRAALAGLKEHVPGVKDRTKSLDRWMLAHLYAQRLEALYADVATVLGVSDADFPPTGEPPEPAPYLGQRDKFVVLLLEKASSVGRYAARWGQGGDPAPQVLNFHRRGSIAFVTCAEFFQGSWSVDAALHAHVTWQVTQNLLRGYLGFRHEPSTWIRQGLAHLFARRVDPRYCPLPRVRETVKETESRPDWAPSVRALVGHEVYPTLAEMWTWTDADERSFAEHRFLWSRIDHLTQVDPEAFARFARACKSPVPDVEGRVASAAEVASHEQRALLVAYGWTPEQADAAWVEFVESTYPRK